MLNFLGWKAIEARRQRKLDVERLERYRLTIQQYDRWFASHPDIVLLLANLRAHAEGHGSIGEHAKEHGRFCDIPELRQRINELREAQQQYLRTTKQDVV